MTGGIFRLAMSLAFGDSVVAVVTYPDGGVVQYSIARYCQFSDRELAGATTRLVERDVLIRERNAARVQ